MKTLSLARIMYGTSEEFHVSDGVDRPAASSFPPSSSTNHADGNATEPESLGELLHRAWTNLSGRN
jgi:hypothetical protein